MLDFEAIRPVDPRLCAAVSSASRGTAEHNEGGCKGEIVSIRQDDGQEAAFRWSVANITFDEASWDLRVDDQQARLEGKPLQVLSYLLRHANEVVTKDELLDTVWAGRVVVEGALTNAIGKLRQALRDHEQRVIVTVPRVGYKLTGKVERKAVQRAPHSSRLHVGDHVPMRPNWMLSRQLDHSESAEAWLVVHAKTGESRVIKFSLDGSGLRSLKREVVISRLLHQTYGERPDFVRVTDWNFEESPYFIESEYGGSDLEEWATSQGAITAVSLPHRLELLVEIAEAVAAAHAIGILHKDLKPGNVLVYGNRNAWHSRVVDFGSGHLMDIERLDAAGITRVGLTETHVGDPEGTLLYIAPELLEGCAPTAQSDIYSLGIMLYQLVVGDLRRPLSATWQDEVDDPLLREDIALAANGHPEARLNSARELAQRLRTLAERRAQRAEARDAESRLAASEKALALNRARRPWLVASVLILLAGAGASTALYLNARKASRYAEVQYNIAQAVNHFLDDDLLAAASPLRGGRVNVTVQQALNEASPQINKRFATEPRIAAAVHYSAGQAYYQLTAYKQAAAQFENAASLFAKAEGKSSVDAGQANILWAECLIRLGDRKTGAAILDRVQPELATLSKSRPLISVYFDRAKAWLYLNNLNFAGSGSQSARAVPLLEHASELISRSVETDPVLAMTIEQLLTSARARSGASLDGEEFAQKELLAKLEAVHGADAPVVLTARLHLAEIQMLEGKERYLAPTYIQLIKDSTRVLGPDDETTLQCLHDLSLVYMKLEQWPELADVAERAYQGFSHTVGPDSVEALNSLDNRAVALLRMGQVDTAASSLEQGAQPLRGKHDPSSNLLLMAFDLNLGHVRLAQHQWAAAAALVKEIDTRGQELIQHNTDAAGELAYIDGCVLAHTGKPAQAVVQLTRGISLLLKKNPPTYWIIEKANAQLAQVQSGALLAHRAAATVTHP